MKLESKEFGTSLFTSVLCLLHTMRTLRIILVAAVVKLGLVGSKFLLVEVGDGATGDSAGQMDNNLSDDCSRKLIVAPK